MKKLFLLLIAIFIIPSSAVAIIQNVKVSNNTNAAVSISWVTDSENTGEVHYNEIPDMSNSKIAYDKRGRTFKGCTHYVDIKNLKKNTYYFFEVASGKEVDNKTGIYYSFKTMKEPFSPPGICMLYGKVFDPDGLTGAKNAIAFLEVRHGGSDSYPLSTIVDSNGGFLFNVKEARAINTDDLFASINKGDPIQLSAVKCAGLAAEKHIVFKDCTYDCGSIFLSYSQGIPTTTPATTTAPPGGGGDSGVIPGGGGGGGTVTTTVPEPGCAADSECDDGNFCNGPETCESGKCVKSKNPCGKNEICDGANNVCVPMPPGPPKECDSDQDCLNSLFCDGEERCISGICGSGSKPCNEDEVCMEDIDACWSFEKISALSLQKTLSRPLLKRKKCTWLVLKSSGEHHFDPETSTMNISGPGVDAKGVVVDTGRYPVEARSFILVPVCIDKDATKGRWEIEIQTIVREGEKPFEERIEADFEVK